MFENGFVYGTPLVAAAEKKEFLRTSQLEKYLYRRIHKGERFVKMLYSKLRLEIM